MGRCCYQILCLATTSHCALMFRILAWSQVRCRIVFRGTAGSVPRPLSLCADVLIDKVASIRTVILGAPLYLAFRSLTGGESMPAAIPYRGTDVLYTIPRPQHVAVIFLLNFEDVTEKNIARIIAQEFVENQPKVGRAPPVSFSIKDPPAVRFCPFRPFTAFLSIFITCLSIRSCWVKAHPLFIRPLP